MKIGTFEIPKLLIWVVLIGLPIFFFISICAKFNNEEVRYRTTFNMQMKNRTALFDKVWKVVKQKAQIAKSYDSSFLRVVKAAMDPRKDGPNIMVKWVQETNPIQDVRTVQELYVDLSRTIQSERDGFFEREELLSSIQQQHSQFLLSFPNNIINIFFGRKELEYKPITSDRTEKVMETGKDNDVNVF